MDNLLPCPFCGSKAKRHDIEAREDVDNAGASYIECDGCGVSTQLHFDRKENLLDSWNKRVKAAGDWCCAANPHSVVPQDCDWPNCGCDPHAERVILGLVECGWESPHAVGQIQRRIKELRGTLADAWQGFREKGHFNEAARIEAAMPDLKTMVAKETRPERSMGSWHTHVQNDQVTVSLDHYTALVRDHQKLTAIELARCEDCPPSDYSTDKTRCSSCDRRDNASPPPQSCHGSER